MTLKSLQLLLLSTIIVLLAGAKPLDDAFGVQEGQEVRIVDDGEEAVDFGHDFDQLDNSVDFMLPSTTVVRGPPTKSGPQARVIGSAMCDLYPRGDVRFPVSESAPRKSRLRFTRVPAPAEQNSVP